MARQVLPIVGAVVGAYFGMPQLGYAIGSLIGNAVDPLKIQGPKIGDNGVQTSAEGAIRPVVYGTGPVVGNIISRGNRQIKKKKKKQGKGGPVTVTEHVYWTFAIRICEGPIAAVTRIWEDEKLVYDIRPGSPIAAESAKYGQRFTLYLGDETQLPDPDLEVYGGMGNVNAHRGTAYIVFPNYDLTDRRESIPNYRFEVATDVAGTQAVTASVVFGNQVLDSPDGFDWSGAAETVAAAASYSYIVAGPDRRIVWGHLLSAYSVNGAPWIQSPSSLGGSGGYRQGIYYDDAYYICGGSQPVYRSLDGGASFNQISGSPSIHFLQRSNDLWVSKFGDGTYRSSASITGTWTVGAVSNQSTSSFASGGGITMAGGTLAGSVSIQSFADVASVTDESLPATPGATTVGCIASDRQGKWVAGLNDGTILYKDEFGWHIATSALGAAAAGAIHNGSNWIMTGAGVIKTSLDGDVWVTARSVPGDGYSEIAAFTEIPPQIVGQPVPLSSIVAAIHARARVPASHYSVTELTDLVDGVVLAADFSCAAAIRATISPAFADSSEYNRRIWFPKRGKPVVKVLTIDDLVDEPEDSTRENAIEYPKKLHMFFQNPLIGYAPAKATAMRSSPDQKVIGEITTQIPWVVDDVDRAARICDIMMKIAWAEAGGEVKLTVTDEHMDMVNADCIGLVLRGQVRRLRIVQIEDNPGTRSLTLRADRQSAYTSNVTGIPLPAPVPPPPSIAGLTISEFLDLPALSDSDDDLHYLAAATGQTAAWSGALYQRSLDAGANYVDATTFNGNTAMGVLLDPITDASEHYTDGTNVVRVLLYLDDEIDSLTTAQFLSRGGAFAIEKTGGGWEVMQYRDADETGDRIVELSTLLRGRLNTGTEAHAAGDRFVLFDLLRKVPASTAWINQALTHRAISFNTTPESAVPYTETYTAQSQTEWPVASFTLGRTVDTLSGVIVPRHRFGTDDNPVRSLHWESYLITASDGTLSQTITQAADAFSIDVTGYASPVTVTVAQVNRFTGAGPTLSEVIA